MPPPLSAIDTISPAFKHAKRELFQPFRLSFWARLALVAAATGEFYSSGGWSGYQYAAPSRPGGGTHPILTFVGPSLGKLPLRQYFPLIVLAAVLAVAGVIFWLYVSSVFRFILFDAVLTNRCHLKEEWRRWRRQGIRFLVWRIVFGLAVAAALSILAGAAALLAVSSGALHDPRQHIALLVLGGLGFFLALALLLISAALIAVFAKDFLVPVMALEDLGVVDGWRRVIAMLKAEKGAYTGYILMKIVLSVGCAILFGILTLVATVALLIPLSIAGYGAYAYVSFNALTMGLAVVAGVAALGLVIYVAAFISAPAMVFFQAYAIHFLGSRYALLGERLPLPGPPALPSAPEASPAV
ncbi:MAG TPA: hypothetical protein VMW54_11355 [Terriglobia bacterium]|nr:hypothetical protein [Terriglobia bacterium]